jgi:hypothetical protein
MTPKAIKIRIAIAIMPTPAHDPTGETGAQQPVPYPYMIYPPLIILVIRI